MYINSDTIELKINQYQFNEQSGARRHPLLPVKRFEQAGREIDVTEEFLMAMADNFNKGPKRPITIAHPKLDAAEAHGWLIPGTAHVSSFGDTKALYAEIEWSGDMVEKIKSKKFGYISPVFTSMYTDQEGNKLGPNLLAAGVTNTPHWTDQDELWNYFTQYVESIDSSNAVITANDNQSDKGDDTMADDKVLESEAKISEMTAEIETLRSENAELKAKADNQVNEFTATMEASKVEVDELKKRIAELEGVNKEHAGKELINSFSAQLKPHRVYNEDGSYTVLGQMAFDEPEKFSAIVSSFPVFEPQTEPVGTDVPDESTVSFSDRQIALANELQESDPKMDRIVALLQAEKQLKDKE